MEGGQPGGREAQVWLLERFELPSRGSCASEESGNYFDHRFSLQGTGNLYRKFYTWLLLVP